jgi:hypothetical protein
MFRTEQNIKQINRKDEKSGISRIGTTLARKDVMRHHLTHKDLTMILGILVALVIAFTLWVRTPQSSEAFSPSSTPSLPQPPTASRAIKATTSLIFETGKTFLGINR